MKKLSFSLVVVLLVSVIITLIGYNSLTIHKNAKKYKSQTNSHVYTEDAENTSDSDDNTSSLPTVYCIGDSLTLGTKKTSYPNAISSMTNLSVNKFGGASDKTIDLATRLGKYKIYVQNITIPANSQSINIDLYDEKGNIADVLHGNGSNFSLVTISGISGKLAYNSTSKKHTFTRSEAGKALKIQKAQVEGEMPVFENDSVAIIFTGTYDDSVQNGIFRTVTYQRSIISALKNKKYIVVSLTSKRKFSIVDDMNTVLANEHKDHFLDFRTYLLQSGLKDAGITATAQDKQDLSKGYIPSSLLEADKVNGNSKFNDLLAKQILNKMVELKYIDEKEVK